MLTNLRVIVYYERKIRLETLRARVVFLFRGSYHHLLWLYVPAFSCNLTTFPTLEAVSFLLDTAMGSLCLRQRYNWWRCNVDGGLSHAARNGLYHKPGYTDCFRSRLSMSLKEYIKFGGSVSVDGVSLKVQGLHFYKSRPIH